MSVKYLLLEKIKGNASQLNDILIKQGETSSILTDLNELKDALVVTSHPCLCLECSPFDKDVLQFLKDLPGLDLPQRPIVIVLTDSTEEPFILNLLQLA